MIYPHGIAWGNYDYVDPQLTVKHDHTAYVQGWCATLEWWGMGYHGITDDCPYSRHYNYSRFKSWHAGVLDADRYLIERFDGRPSLYQQYLSEQ
jgi:hypothetical protein